jgi:hypothetical protein
MPTLELAWYESLICERTMAAPCHDSDAVKPAWPLRSAARLGKCNQSGGTRIMDTIWHEELSYVIAGLNYLKPMAGKPAAYTYEPPAGTPWRTGENATHAVAIWNARPVAADLSLDVQGFAFVKAPSAVADFYDEDTVRSVYYPEVEALLRAITGAARVLVFDYNLRNGVGAAEGAKGIREPVRRVHNDFTRGSGVVRARDELTARGLDPVEIDGRRFALINLWRPVSGPVKEAPLALCDATTIAPEDFVASDLIFPHRVGETYSVTFNPGHRWYYFPDMTPDEALLIKCFDSAEDGRARFTAHTAFDDPSSPSGAVARESIEVRALAIFAEGV